MPRIPIRTMSRWRARALASALAVSLLAACATITSAPADSRLSGHWVLDAAASDDVGARVAQALVEARKRMRARRPVGAVDSGGGGPGGGGRRGSGGAGSGPDQGGGAGQAPEPAPGAAPRTDGTDDNPESIIDQYGNTRLLGPDFRALSANLVHAVSNPREIELDVNGDTVRVRTEGLPARDYRLGEGFSRFDEYGTAHMQPSWSADAFVLRARYTTGASITERYQVAKGQSTLTRTVDVVDPVIGKLQLHSLYRPAPR
jgi:hypothetical protein